MKRLVKNWTALFTVCLIMGLVGCGDNTPTTVGAAVNAGLVIAEEAYYEGQKDALEGRIRIKKTDRGNYVWMESPWDSGTEPTFHPPINGTAN
jgi:hypothetical protein